MNTILICAAKITNPNPFKCKFLSQNNQLLLTVDGNCPGPTPGPDGQWFLDCTTSFGDTMQLTYPFSRLSHDVHIDTQYAADITHWLNDIYSEKAQNILIDQRNQARLNAILPLATTVNLLQISFVLGGTALIMSNTPTTFRAVLFIGAIGSFLLAVMNPLP